MAKRSELSASYEVRREAASAVVIAVLVLAGLALASKKEGWELVGMPWWTWLVLAIPGLVLCLDLGLGARGVAIVRTRTIALVQLGIIVLGNMVGLGLLVGSSRSCRSSSWSS